MTTQAANASSIAEIPRLELTGVCKAFAGVPAVIDMSLAVSLGEIHALVGENGAGKSTVMNILSGVQLPDGAEIRLDGVPVALTSPRRAQDFGIGTVFQELSLVPALSIAENIFPHRPPTKLGVIRWGALYLRARELLAELDLAVDVRRTVASLDAGTRQLVEIAKALSVQSRLLLLDEPTSALTPHDAAILFRLLRRVRDAGVAIVYVSHQMREVFAIADRITVMRDGRKVGTWRAKETSASEVVRAMVGRDIGDETSADAAIGDERLTVEALTVRGHFRDVSFAIRTGEIVGLAGLIGSGRSELGRALGGARRVDRGRIWVDGRAVSFRSVHDAMRSRIAYLPGERKTEGLFLTRSLADNVVAPSLARVTRFGIVDRAKCDAAARKAIRMLTIRASGPGQPVERLSGGNQQKVLLGRWLMTEPRILIVDEPTKGVDVAAKNEIHEELRRLTRRGTALLVISSDLPELLALCERILVMRAGEIAADIPRKEADEEVVMALAAGLHAHAELAS